MRGLPIIVKNCLNKALDSALLAVEIYNKPATKFKSGGYIVLMCIAWTSLFHAIFFKQGIKPYYREKNSKSYKRVDGEIQFWELAHCVKEYFKGNETAIRKNIEFFIPLRNKLEHKFLPEIDANIFAECESFLLNFDKVVENEFGEKYCLRESLSFALQLFPSSKTLEMSVRSGRDAEKITRFIDKYRASISPDLLNSGEYSFKAFLIQVANHKSSTALPVQFFQYDSLSDEEKKEVDRIVSLTKERQIPVSNKDNLLPGAVVKKVQERLGNVKVPRGKKQVDKFNHDTHKRCWLKYDVRPAGKSDHPERTNPKYCIYDETFDKYSFTPAWVDFLVERMSNEEEYRSLYEK